ncbi:MAG: metallophosphoesterase family protein [Gemmatimonadota bacterium]
MRIAHVSDLHFGPPCNIPVVGALESHLAREAYDVVVVSGDLAQRSLSGELQRGAAFLRDAGKVSQTFVIPGNHDIAWWASPMHILGAAGLYTRYRRYISADLEPVMVAGCAHFVGINTAHGLAPWTLSTRLRDLTIVGAVRNEQIRRTAEALSARAPGLLRVVVMHHNPLRGELSRRFGIVRATAVLSALAAAGAEVVLCGHDHQEHVDEVETTGGRVIVVTAGTLSHRSRGGRACSFHSLTVTESAVTITTHYWNDVSQAFAPGVPVAFGRRRG